MDILIADDDPVSRKLLQNYLQKWGYGVTVAADGGEAWSRFEAGVFPMVLTDWMMPDVDGPELIRRIRSRGGPGYVYAILLTAKSQKEDLVAGMEAGADDFLTKPFDRDELRVRLRAGERIIRLEHDLLRTQTALLQSEQLAGLGRLAAGLAHEINNPIAYVANNLAVLRRDVEGALGVLARYQDGHAALARDEPGLADEVARLAEEMDLPYVRENVGKIFDSSAEGLRRIGAIVANLRDFARVDQAEFKEVDVNDAVRATIESLRHELARKSAVVETSLGELPPIACYPGKLNQALLHILLNAVQFSPEGGRIEVRTRPQPDGGVLVEVEDHGAGIAPDHLPRIFEPFFTTKPVGDGRGLGLAVSYGIVRDHGGTIEVESAPGRGSLFRIRLPAHPPRPAPPAPAPG